MADSLDEEYDPQPSIPKNANIIRSIGARTAEARRRPGRESPEFLRDNASEDETEAPPQTTFRQTAGLRDRSRTELRSNNRRKTTNNGNQFSNFKRSQPVNPRSEVHGSNEGRGLRKVAREDPSQLNPNPMSFISENLDEKRTTQFIQAYKSGLNDDNSVIEDGESSDGSGLSDDGERSPPAGRTPPSGRTFRREDYEIPSTPDGALSEVPLLSLKFGTINNHTISRDKTQGEEACNSELLAAFGRKIQAHVFGETSNQSVDPAVHQSPPTETATIDLRNRLTPPPPPAPVPFRPAPVPYRSSRGYLANISGLPHSISQEAFQTFVRRSNFEFTSAGLKDWLPGHAEIMFNTVADLRVGVERLNGREFRGGRVYCYAVQPPPLPPPGPGPIVYRNPNNDRGGGQ